MNPPGFQGGLNPVLAHDFLSEMEIVFQVVHCTEEDKVLFAPHMTKGPTTRWWANAITHMKEFEFQLLCQGNMYVAEYAERFEEMVAYSRQVAYAPDEKWKIDQFMFSLRGEIEHNVAQREFGTYAELSRKCYIVEYNLKKIHIEREQANPLQINSSKVVYHLKLRGVTSKGKQVQSVGSMSPQQCNICNKFHFGKYKMGAWRCYCCKKKGHTTRDCPNLKAKQYSE
ncbi:uncharacterized protein LOC127121721 [Lathyrus oleraceus]|uniref:uncharacterized protein LOC127121721 n=1 Tax=Pisum sativum TaxID=3888 RepID=UPI0021D0F623|nr:uncharacterized protein LOC127121721 [Pisum sativum]